MRSGQKLKSLILNNRSKYIFLTFILLIFAAFLIASSEIVKDLSRQEKERMDLWATATQKLAAAEAEDDIDFLLSIISRNQTIPVLVADSNFQIIDFRNYNLPDKSDPTESGLSFENLSDNNKEYLLMRLNKIAGNMTLEEASRNNPHFIKIEVYRNYPQYIVYEDSALLKRLSWFPYIQLFVTIILILIIYLALLYSKKAEQNRLWAGLSKETAHQLGTPISSLLAWNQYLESTGVDKDITGEIHKDINRLSLIAERFSKIGSVPELETQNLNAIIESSLAYMSTRISEKIIIKTYLKKEYIPVKISTQLFEWVIENLIKNAVDSMEGQGEVEITDGMDKGIAWIEIKDTGKGISKKNFKKVFSAGFTTKKRGWGLGLTLVKRIIEEYHGGRIFIKESYPEKGTTFRIELKS